MSKLTKFLHFLPRFLPVLAGRMYNNITPPSGTPGIPCDRSSMNDRSGVARNAAVKSLHDAMDGIVSAEGRKKRTDSKTDKRSVGERK